MGTVHRILVIVSSCLALAGAATAHEPGAAPGGVVTVERPPVVLRAPAELPRPEREALAVELAEGAVEMAGTLDLDLGTPIEVVVEHDYVEQGRKLESIGPAVLAAGDSKGGVLHLVLNPDDRFHHRHALARLLLHRAEIALPPILEHGAALVLSGDWYGRSYDDWITDFAAGGVLPEVAELLAKEPPGDASRVLFPPVAAAVIAGLPGDTLRAKLSKTGDGALLARRLAELARRAGGTAEGLDVRLATVPEPAFHNGVSFAMANGLEIGYHAPGVDDQLAHLRRLGADAVSLMPFAYQPTPSAPGLRFLNRHPASETDVGLIHAARRAHAAGFRVLWKPHIWVSHHSWPGEIAMASEQDWRAWFRSYRRFVLHHAVLAQWTGAELFSVGVELGRTVERETEWRHLIAAARRIYRGPMTYAGNWWGDYDRVPFWDALDLVGVDAYFPLASTTDAGDAELAAGVRRAMTAMRQVAERTGKPILLTEVGFAARRGAWISPHEEGGELSEEHQARAYRVFLDTLGRPPWLAGLYVWKVFSHRRAEHRGRPDFRLLGRPAEAVVASYFQVGDTGRRATTAE